MMEEMNEDVLTLILTFNPKVIQMMEEMDEDGSGELDWDEFQRLMARCRP